MTRLSARCLVLLLVASLCFAVFTIGASAADGEPSVTLSLKPFYGSDLPFTATPSSPVSWKSSSYSEFVGGSLSIYLPSAGTLMFTASPLSGTFSLDGLTSTVSSSYYSFTFVSSSAGSFSVTATDFKSFTTKTLSLKITSWTPDTSGGGSGGGESGGNINDSSGNSILGPSQGGMDIWNSDGSINGDQRSDITGNSSQWNINSTYIGQLDYFIEGDEATYETSVWMSKMLANLAYTTWSWKYDESTGNFLYVRPNPGSWLDNMWQMNIYLYYNLANQKGWFGHINSEFATLNSRVLQILSVLANDEDVKIKDATTPEREWIKDYFEDDDPNGPTSGNMTDLRGGFGSITDEFETDKSVTDIGDVFTDSSYDSKGRFDFWSQTVSDDVNGVSRGGFGGGRARAQAAEPSRWADNFDYGDDEIAWAFGARGGAADG